MKKKQKQITRETKKELLDAGLGQLPTDDLRRLKKNILNNKADMLLDGGVLDSKGQGKHRKVFG